MQCYCGEQMSIKKGDMDYVMFDSKIKVLNIEYYHCINCEKETFGEKTSEVTKVLREAYLKKEEKVDFEKLKKENKA